MLSLSSSPEMNSVEECIVSAGTVDSLLDVIHGVPLIGRICDMIRRHGRDGRCDVVVRVLCQVVGHPQVSADAVSMCSGLQIWRYVHSLYSVLVHMLLPIDGCS